jgi:1,4-dihydroxy-2-naphthoate octaprenyltransferase
VLVHGRVDPRIALWIAWTAFGVAGAFGLLLGARVGWEVVGVGVACMVVAYFYSGGPRPIAATPLGELFAGGFLGLLLVGLSAYVQTRDASSDALLVGLPSALVIADILTVNNTCDIRGDAAAGRTTLSILLGERQAHALITTLVACAYALAFALAAVRVLPLVTIAPLAAGAAFAARTLQRMHRRGYDHRTKPPSMAGISQIFLAYTGAVLAGILLDGVCAEGWP